MTRFTMLKSICAAAFGVALLMSTPAMALTVAEGGTGSLGAGNITFQGGGATTDWDASRPGVWTNAVTTPASYWVRLDGTIGVFEFTFDLTDYDLSTVAMRIDWSVDNTGNVDLNGTDISGTYTNFRAIQTLNIDSTGNFAQGINTVLFNASGDGTTDGFRAAVSVSADLLPVPLPATLPMLLAGFGLLAVHRRRANR